MEIFHSTLTLPLTQCHLSGPDRPPTNPSIAELQGSDAVPRSTARFHLSNLQRHDLTDEPMYVFPDARRFVSDAI